MSEIEDGARAFWRAASWVRRSEPGSVLRRVCLGQLVDSRDLMITAGLSNRLNLLLAQYGSEIQGNRPSGSAS